MSKKARRRQIMEAIGYPDMRVDYVNENGDFTYIRSGDLLRVELEALLKAFDAWHPSYDHQHKRALRSHIRDAVGLKYDGMGWERFDKHDLHEIWLEVRDD